MPISIPVVLDTESLESQLADLKRKAQETGKAVGDGIGSGAKKAEKSADDAAKGLEDLGDAAGLPVDKLKKLSGGFAALANPATAAVVAVGAVALAGVALATGIVKAVVAAEELSKALAPLRDQKGFGITKEQLASIKGANDAMGAMGAIVKQVVARLGAEFAPVIEKGATLLVKFGLMALDAFNTFADGKDILRELAIFMADMFFSSILGVFNGVANLVGMMGKLARAVGKEELAGKLEAVNEKWDDFTRGLATKAVDYAIDGIKRIDTATGNYDERAKKLIGSVRELDKAHKDIKDTLDDLTKGVDEQLQGWSAGMGLVGDDLVLVKQEVDAAVEAGMAGLGGMTDQALDLTLGLDKVVSVAEDLGTTFGDKVVNATSAVQGGLEGIITLIGGPVAGAIAGLILNLESVVANLKTQLLDLFTAATQVSAIKQEAAATNASYEERISALKEALSEASEENNSERMADIQKEIAALQEEQEAAAAAADKQIAAVKAAGGLLERLPYVVTDFVVSFVDTFIPMFVKSMPDIAKKFALALTSPEFLAAVAKIALYLISPWVQFAFWAKVGAEIFKGLWDAFLSGWSSFVSGQMFADVKGAIVSGFESAIDSLRAAWDDIVQRIQDVLSFKWAKGGGSVIGDLVTELVSLGSASTKTFGDSPSMQRAGPQGGMVRTSPGDHFLVGRNPQALLEQALNGVFGAGSATPAMAGGGGGQINMAWQHRAFDGFFVRHAQLGGQTTSLFQHMKASKDARGM